MYPPYEWYITSPQWKEKRAQRMAIDGIKCALCGSRHNLQVHHITYERLGFENIETDLITLCHTCHERLHSFEGTPMWDAAEKKVKSAASKAGHRYFIKLTYEFCKENAEIDIYEKTLCNWDVLREMLPKYYAEHGCGATSYPRLAHARDFFVYFRYKKAIQLLSSGCSANEILRNTQIRRKAIDKVIKEPDVVRRHINSTETEIARLKED